jgi:hypothetical protein
MSRPSKQCRTRCRRLKAVWWRKEGLSWNAVHSQLRCYRGWWGESCSFTLEGAFLKQRRLENNLWKGFVLWKARDCSSICSARSKELTNYPIQFDEFTVYYLIVCQLISNSVM